jgi:hypothetical protein
MTNIEITDITGVCGFRWREAPQPGEQANEDGFVVRTCVLPPHHNDTAHEHDDSINVHNYVVAVAGVTKLPTLPYSNVRKDLNWAKGTPQASAVSWALWRARERGLDSDDTLVLVALAQHAAAALWSGDGYSYTTAEDIRALLGYGSTLVIDRLMSTTGGVWTFVEDRCDAQGNVLGWRIPDEALDGNWLDRATRIAHYGKATDHVRR